MQPSPPLPADSAAAPPSRFVALGASNLTRFALPLLDAARCAANGRVEAHFALGFGRSYGMPSRVLWRGRSGIDRARLWPALAAAPRRAPAPAPAPAQASTALVMDVGNDLLYGVPVPRVLEVVDVVLQRLADIAERRIVAGIALGPARRVSEPYWWLIRNVLVPNCPLTRLQAIAGAERLHEGLRELAARRGAQFVEPRDEWYGTDPVHFRARHFAAVARTLLALPPTAVAPEPHCANWRGRVRYRFAQPFERTVFGRRRSAPQPALHCADGSTLSLW